jgi:hypothetical protein
MDSIQNAEQDAQLAALKKLILSLKPGNGKHFYKMNVETLEVSRVHGDDYRSYVSSLSERKEDIVPKPNHLYCVAKTQLKACTQFGKILHALTLEYANNN